MEKSFKQMVGQVCLFYGVDNDRFKLNDEVWEGKAIDVDGYRESFDVLHSYQDVTDIFFQIPIAQVRVEDVEDDEYVENALSGYALVDVQDGYVWLRVGVTMSDPYYPMYRFEYLPKETFMTNEGRSTYSIIIMLQDGNSLPVLFAQSQGEANSWLNFFQEDPRVGVTLCKNNADGKQSVWTNRDVSQELLLKALGFEQRG